MSVIEKDLIAKGNLEYIELLEKSIVKYAKENKKLKKKVEELQLKLFKVNPLYEN